MSDIPQARARLHAVLEQLEQLTQEVTEIEALMYKTFTKPRAPVRSVKMTKQLAKVIADFARRNPTMSSQQIGDIFNVNPGRVSQALQEYQK